MLKKNKLNIQIIIEALLVLAVTLGILAYFTQKALRQEALLNAEQLLEGTMQDIDNILLNVEQSTANVYYDLLEHLDDPDRMFTYSKELVENNPNIIGCAIVFKPGFYPGKNLFMAYVHRRSSDTYDQTELVTSETFIDRPYNEQVWYTIPVEEGKIGWIDPLKGKETENEPLVTFCLPFRDKTGERVGAIAVDVAIQSCTDKDMVSEKELSSITEMMKDNYVSMNRMALMLNDATETDVKGTLSCRRENEISCNKLAKECIDYTLGLAPEANIQFETELKDSELILTCDIYLRNILCELLYNAVKGSDGKNVGLQISQTKNNVCFTVQDAGPGLPDNLPDIDPFTITDNLSEATGIGLVLAKRHATALGGNLSIDTDYHDGCRITVEMPK